LLPCCLYGRPRPGAWLFMEGMLQHVQRVALLTYNTHGRELTGLCWWVLGSCPGQFPFCGPLQVGDVGADADAAWALCSVEGALQGCPIEEHGAESLGRGHSRGATPASHSSLTQATPQVSTAWARVCCGACKHSVHACACMVMTSCSRPAGAGGDELLVTSHHGV
jgi:hypothetical protein